MATSSLTSEALDELREAQKYVALSMAIDQVIGQEKSNLRRWTMSIALVGDLQKKSPKKNKWPWLR
jgi:hypothetical protein